MDQPLQLDDMPELIIDFEVDSPFREDQHKRMVRNQQQSIEKLFSNSGYQRAPIFLFYLEAPGSDELQRAPIINRQTPTRQRDHSRLWQLHRPVMPPVRDFVFELRLADEKRIGLDELRDYLYLHEIIIFCFNIKKNTPVMERENVSATPAETGQYDDMPELEDASSTPMPTLDGFYHGWLQLGGKGINVVDSLAKIK